MAKYRKKPVVIEAIRWNTHGDHPAVTPYGYGQFDPYSVATCLVCGKDFFLKGSLDGMGILHFTHGQIKTLESKIGSEHLVCPGDYIITGVVGEVYPCKPDIFEQTYEKVVE